METATTRAARAAEDSLDSQHALTLYLAADRETPGDPYLLQEIAKQYSDTIVDLSDRAKKRRYAEQALAYSKRAAALAPGDAAAQVAVAISYGKLALVGNPRTRVDAARHIGAETERALALDPNSDWAHHVLGRWNLELIEIGSVTRLMAKLLYGGVPAGSLREALRHLQKAVALAPANPSHHLELGIALAHADRVVEARREIEIGINLRTMTKYDEDSKRRGQEELARLGPGS